MKYLLLIITALIFSTSTFADTGTLEAIEVDTDHVGVNFEDNDKTLVLTFSDNIVTTMHSVIDLRKISNLEYKTRVMRYFGGLLVNDTYNFKSLVVIIDGKRFEYNWNRENVSAVVKKMCQKAEYAM